MFCRLFVEHPLAPSFRDDANLIQFVLRAEALRTADAVPFPQWDLLNGDCPHAGDVEREDPASGEP